MASALFDGAGALAFLAVLRLRVVAVLDFAVEALAVLLRVDAVLRLAAVVLLALVLARLLLVARLVVLPALEAARLRVVAAFFGVSPESLAITVL
ncbi:hypothetical protein S4A8_02600 [Salinisphaera sp. S4-8]